MTPKELIKQEAMFTEAHGNFEKKLKTYAYFKTHNRALGEDLVQNTFIKTWSYIIKGGKIEIMNAFLYHVLNNLIVDEYRKKKTTSLDVLLEKGFAPGDDSAERLINILDGKAALLLIQRLPEKFQKVMRMRYVEDLSLREMAEITGQSKNTVAVQAHRGLEKLKAIYAPTLVSTPILLHIMNYSKQTCGPTTKAPEIRAL